MKKSYSLSPEHRQQKVQEAMDTLNHGLEDLLSEDNWKQFLHLQRLFHGYSFSNVVMILAQFPTATQVAGFKKWAEMDRHVKKGAHGITIWAPSFKKEKEKKIIEHDEADKLEETERTKLSYFFPVQVFDVSQTGGAPIPMTPTISMTVKKETELYARLRSVCPFPVTEVDSIDGDSEQTKGVFRRRSQSIEILTNLSESEKMKTLVHEWAHGLLHTREEDAKSVPHQVKELEAESTAFVVCNALELDTSSYSFGYIASWTGEESVKWLKISGPRIQKAVHVILTALTAEKSNEPEETQEAM
jgi:antirestriction protein ArdC